MRGRRCPQGQPVTAPRRAPLPAACHSPAGRAGWAGHTAHDAGGDGSCVRGPVCQAGNLTLRPGLRSTACALASGSDGAGISCGPTFTRPFSPPLSRAHTRRGGLAASRAHTRRGGLAASRAHTRRGGLAASRAHTRRGGLAASPAGCSGCLRLSAVMLGRGGWPACRRSCGPSPLRQLPTCFPTGANAGLPSGFS